MPRILALLSLFVVGCSAENLVPITPPIVPPDEPLMAVDDPSLTGTWVLRTVGGVPLPYWIGDRARQAADGYKVEMTSETLVIIPPKLAIRIVAGTHTDHGRVTEWGYPDTGSYVITKAGVTFDSEYQPGFTGSINGTTLSAVTGEAGSRVYEKQ
jgi:hypothetical protein